MPSTATGLGRLSSVRNRHGLIPVQLRYPDRPAICREAGTAASRSQCRLMTRERWSLNIRAGRTFLLGVDNPNSPEAHPEPAVIDCPVIFGLYTCGDGSEGGSESTVDLLHPGDWRAGSGVRSAYRVFPSPTH